jgi:7,8-dihydropterin-6-yl-methyl-4-(beta-D-ribofuranosyl)aminobenzene 5'-phosphate synthase
MKVKIIYDNTVYKEGLQSDWGFSCLVEVENTPKILFDTGADGSILLSNMKKLNINPASIDEVFISHAHFDHVGGLSSFLEVNSDVKVYVPVSFRGVRGVKEVISISEPLKIHENVFSTGELDRIEQSMAVKTDKGIVLIVGCSHPKMAHILDAASQFGKVYAIIGGLHGFREYDLFKDLELICPTHCTQHKAEIRSLYSENYVDGGAGKIILV